MTIENETYSVNREGPLEWHFLAGGTSLVEVLALHVIGGSERHKVPCAQTMDSILNVGFFVFHTSWIAFTCLGWMWRRARPWHLAAVSLTAMSWFGLGMLYGWGYCPCTDWHWQVRARLGHQDPPSYIQLLISQLTGIELSPTWADALALCTLVVVAILSAVMNLRDRRAHACARA